MGSLDIPPFMREKMKAKAQAQQPADQGTEPVVPPFLKKKDQTGGDVSVTGSQSQSTSPSSSSGEPIIATTPEHEAVAIQDARSLVNNFNTNSDLLKAKADDSPFITDKLAYNTYLQSREAKTGRVVNDIINKGHFNTDDINYLSKAAPEATKQLVKSFVPDAKPGEELSPQNIQKMTDNGQKAVSDMIIQQKIEGNNTKDTEVKQLLSQNGIDPAKLTDPTYATQVSSDVQAKQATELAALNKKYPQSFYGGAGGAGAPVRQNETQYNKDKAAIEQKYQDINNQIGLSHAYDYAKDHPTSVPKDVGEQWYKYSDPDAYKLWVKNGKKGPIDHDIAQVGINALYGSGKPGTAQLASKDEDTIDDQYPDELIAETYHRLGAELYKNENWLLNPVPSVDKLDKAAEQLPQRYKDAYYKHIRETEKHIVGTNVPMSGLLNKVGEGFSSTAIETGKFVGDVTGIRTKADQVKEAVNEPVQTQFQDVGEYAPAQQRLAVLNSKPKLSADEIHEKQDLETYTGVRSKGQTLVDGSGNLLGQVIFQAVGTKGVAGLLGKGIEATGLLKAETAAVGLTSDETIAHEAMNFGVTKNTLTNISADAIAYGSSFDSAQRDAYRLMPDDKDSGKRLIYSNIVAGLNAATERIFKDEKVLNAFNKDISPNIKALVEKLSAGEITKETLVPSIVKILKSSASFVGHATIENTKESVEEVASSIGTSIATAVLAPAKYNDQDAFDNATSTFTSMFANGGLVAAMAGLDSHRATHVGIPAFSQFGVNEKFTNDVKSFINAQVLSGNFTQEEADKKFGIIAAASNVNKIILPQVKQVTKMSDRTQGKYGMQLLNEQILKSQIQDGGDRVLNESLEQKIKDSEALRKGLIGKDLFVDDNYRIRTSEQMHTDPAPAGLVTPEGFTRDENGALKQNDVKSNEQIEEEVKKTVPESVARMATKEIEQLHKDDKFPPAVSSIERQEAVKHPLQFLKSIAEQINTTDNIVGSNLNARDGAVNYYGEDLVSMAEEIFPNQAKMGSATILNEAAEKGGETIKRTVEAFSAEGKTDEAVDHLKEKALDSPNDLKKDLNQHKNLTVDIIAQNTPSEINEALLKFEDDKKTEEAKEGETKDPAKIAEIDKHIALLKEGLDKAHEAIAKTQEKPRVRVTADQLREAQPADTKNKVSNLKTQKDIDEAATQNQKDYAVNKLGEDGKFKIKQDEGNSLPRQTVNADHKEAVQQWVKDGRYEEAVTNGTLSPSKAKDIIESAGVRVPRKIERAVRSESAPKGVNGEKMSYEDFRDEMLDAATLVKSSKYDFRITIPGLDHKGVEQAVRNIDEGKETVAAKRMEDAIKEMHDNGVVSVNRGTGNQAESYDIPIKQWFGLTPDEQSAAKTIDLDDDTLQSMIDDGITENNIDDLKHLFNGFPYTQEDFAAVKSLLAKTGESDAANKQAGENTKSEKQQQAPVKENLKPAVKKLADELATMLGNHGMSELAQSEKISLKDLGIEKGDSITDVLNKLIEHGGEFTDVFKFLRGLSDIDQLKFEVTHKVGYRAGEYVPKANLLEREEDRRTVRINPNVENAYYAIAHEVAHFHTLDSEMVQKYGDKKKISTLQDIYNFLAKKTDSKSYGFKNFTEFLAELPLNSDLRQEVSGVVASEKEFNNALGKSKSVLEYIHDFIKGIVEKLFGTSEHAKDIDFDKPLIESAAKLYTDVFFSGQKIIPEESSGWKSLGIQQMDDKDNGNPALPMSKPDRESAINSFVKTKLDDGVRPEDIHDALVANGISDKDAKRYILDNGDTEYMSHAQNVEADKSILPGARKLIAANKEYLVQHNVNSISEAQRVIKEMGHDEAYNAVTTGEGISAATRVIVGNSLIKYYNEQAINAKTKASKNFFIQRTADIANFVSEKLGKEAGQMIQAFSLYSALTPEAQIMVATKNEKNIGNKVQRKYQNSVSNLGSKLQEANAQAADEVTKSSKVQSAVADADKATEKKKKDKLQTIRDKRQAIIDKFKKGGSGITLSSGGLTSEGIEFVGDLAKTYIDEGIVHVAALAEKIGNHLKELGVNMNDAVNKHVNDVIAEQIYPVQNKNLRKGLGEMAKGAQEALDTYNNFVPEEAKDEIISNFMKQANVETGDRAKLEKDARQELENIINRKTEKPAKNISADQAKKASDKGAMADLEKSINDIVKKHYTVPEEAQKSLTKKFIDQLGLEGEDAKKLAEHIQNEFERIATRKKEDLLYKEKRRFDRIKNGMQGAKETTRRELQDELIKFSNLGAFDNAQLSDVIKDKLGLGQLAPEQIKEIQRLSEKIQKAPEGSPKRDATQALLSYQANLKGKRFGELAQAVWYSNVLSGYGTHIKNIVSTFYSGLAYFGAEAVRDPRAIPALVLGGLHGAKRGLVEAWHTTTTGSTPIHESKVETPDILERTKFVGGWYNPGNYLKFVGRLMKAEDVLQFQALKEMRATQLAFREAQKEGYGNPFSKKTWDVVNEKLLLTPERSATAIQQANDEKLKGTEWKRRVYELMEQNRPIQMTDDAYGFAAHGTFNHDTEGALGALTDGLAHFIDKISYKGVKPIRFFIPFTRIIANVANNMLDFTPYGFVRGIRGTRSVDSGEKSWFGQKFHEMSSEERAQHIAKASLGVALTGALWAMTKVPCKNDPSHSMLEITGNGTGDYKKDNELKQAGWQPYSIRTCGGTYYSYALTPLMLNLGVIGSVNDYQKYNPKGNDLDILHRMELAGKSSAGMLSDMTWIGNSAELLKAVSTGDPKDVENLLENSAKSLVIPNAYTQIAQRVQSIYGMPQKEVNGFVDRMIQDIPIARGEYLNDRINALGDPVVRDPDLLYSNETKDPVWKFLLDKKGWVAPVNKNTLLIYDEDREQERPVTPKEYYEFSKLRGSKIKAAIQEIMDNGALVNDDDKVTTSENTGTGSKPASELSTLEFRNLLKQISGKATKEAKKELFPGVPTDSDE